MSIEEEGKGEGRKAGVEGEQRQGSEEAKEREKRDVKEKGGERKEEEVTHTILIFTL